MFGNQHSTWNPAEGVAAALFALLLAVAIAGVPAQAAGLQAQAPQQEETVSSAEVSEEELEQFTKSIMQVQEIHRELEAELAGVQEPAQVQQLQQEAQVEMVQAIEEEGLDVSRYNVIARSIQADPALAQRFEQKRAELEEEDEDS